MDIERYASEPLQAVVPEFTASLPKEPIYFSNQTGEIDENPANDVFWLKDLPNSGKAGLFYSDEHRRKMPSEPVYVVLATNFPGYEGSFIEVGKSKTSSSKGKTLSSSFEVIKSAPGYIKDRTQEETIKSLQETLELMGGKMEGSALPKLVNYLKTNKLKGPVWEKMSVFRTTQEELEKENIMFWLEADKSKIQEINTSSVAPTEASPIIDKEGWITPSEWHGIIGQTNARKELEKILLDQQGLDQQAQWGHVISDRGFLFYGPTGTGKTSLGKAMAEAMNAKLITINAGQDEYDTVGTNIVKAREKFNEAKRLAKEGKKTVILVDEVDKFITAKNDRNPHQSYKNDETSGFMTLVEDVLSVPKSAQQVRERAINGYDNILVIGTTNHVNTIEAAAMRPGRFGRKVECQLPTSNEERRDLVLHASLPTIESANAWRKTKGLTAVTYQDYFDFSYSELTAKAQELAGYSQAEIDSGTREALQNFVRQKSVNEKYKIALPELLASIVKTKAGKVYAVEAEFPTLQDPTWVLPVKWHGIIGQTRAIEAFKAIIENSSKNPGQSNVWGSTPSNRGFLLYGPTGTGKTSLGMAMATEMGAEIVKINAGNSTYDTVGTEEVIIRQRFNEAKELAKTGKKVVILFDEVEKFIYKKRTSESNNSTLTKYQNDETSAVMTLVEEVLSTPKSTREKEERLLNGFDNIVIIGTTNHIDNIEEAAMRPKRFGQKIECGLPTSNQERHDLILNATLPTINEANLIRQENKIELVSFGDYFDFTSEELMVRCDDLVRITQAEIEAGVEASLAKLLRMKQVNPTIKLKLTDLIAEISNTL